MVKIPNSHIGKDSKHPLIREYDSFFTNNSTFEDREELIYDFYNRNQELVNSIDDINSNLIIEKLIEMKIVYIRILDGKQEYKKCEPVCEQLKLLLSKLSENYHCYNSLYLNGYKWIAINLGRRNKYFASNKIFKELICMDDNKELYKNWISSNYSHIIFHWVTYPLFIVCSFIFIWNAIIDLFIGNYYLYIGKPYSVITSLLLFIAVIIYFNVYKLIKYLVNRKYK